MRLLALMKKELLQFWRDPVLLIMVFYGFTFDVYLAGKGYPLEIQNFPVAVYDQDRSQASASLLEHLRPPKFRVTVVHDAETLDRLLLSGRVLMGVVVDADFTRRLARNESAPVQVLIDGTHSIVAALALNEVTQILTQSPLRYLERVQVQLRRLPVGLRWRVLYNPNADNTWAISLIELFTIITLASMLLPAAAVVREKERGTMEQLLVSPLRRWEVMLAKILPMTGVGLLFTLLSVFAVLHSMMDLVAKGSLAVFFLATVIYIHACAGLGLFMAAISRNLSQLILILITAIVPILFLSGTWAPREAMPGPIQVLTHLSPLSYFVEIGMGVFFRGWGLTESVMPLLRLAGFGVVLFVLGATWLGKSVRTS